MFGSRYVVALQKILGERFRPFKLGSFTARSQTAQPFFGKTVNDTFYKWSFGTDDGQINAFKLGKFTKPIGIVSRYSDVFHAVFVRRARISWGNKYRVYTVGLCKLPGQCVFPTPTADYQYFCHRVQCRK